MQVADEEVWCECSDDEMYNPGKEKKGTWQPKPEDILKVFEELKTKKVLELSWKCPGRKHPDDDVKKEEDVKEEVITTPVRKTEQRPAVPNEFDFDDDTPDSKVILTPRRTPGSAPKSEKKVARMDKVLQEMAHQRKLQAAEREARKQAKSARTPGSPGRARIGSPAGSPRTPPASGSNRQSPVRSAGPPDPITTTPLRAPIDSPRQFPKETDRTVPSPATRVEPTDNALTKTSSNPKLSQTVIDTQASMFSQSQGREASIPGSGLPRQATPPVASGNAANSQSFQQSVNSLTGSNNVAQNTAEQMDTS